MTAADWSASVPGEELVLRQGRSDQAGHVAEALRVLELPIEVSGMHWHPFGVYTIPLAKRTGPDGTWSRRMHIWHPSGTPVGPASPYGVHSHTGDALSHVLAGAVHHHLYAFRDDPEGAWQVEPDGHRASLVAHSTETTTAGMWHSFPADHAHGVTKDPEVMAVSLFAQRDEKGTRPFTTWQRIDLPAEELVRRSPAPLDKVRRDAIAALVPLA